MDFIYLLLALIICVTLHEAAHAYTAFILGDPTAKMEGRVSLNPLRHLDLIGTIMIFLVHFGWGKPVPFNYHNLKHPRRDAAIIAFAGPFSNFLTAALLAIVVKYAHPHGFLLNAIQTIFSLSLVLFLFNLIPIAPLDGSKLLGMFIPRSHEEWYERFLSKGPMMLIALIVLDRLVQEISGFSVLGTYLQYGYELITAGLFFIT